MQVLSSKANGQWLAVAPTLPPVPGAVQAAAPIPEDPARAEAKRALSDVMRCSNLDLESESDDAGFPWKEEPITDLLTFLRGNARWNEAFQEREYARSLASCTSSRDRLITFLHLNVSTQSGADMDGLQPFWVALHAATTEQLSTLTSFTEYLVQKVSKEKKSVGTRKTPGDVWETLFVALNSHFGWGVKTTALFVKAAIKLHRGSKALHFWPDATREVAPVLESRLFLPVDRVIIRVFEELGHPNPRIDSINRGLRKAYTGEDMLTWDDLWFWGFFTQKGTGAKRTLGWNSANSGANCLPTRVASLN